MTEMCPLCHRALGTIWDEHHLIPKCEEGKDKEAVHIICHRKIHSVFTENELRDYFYTWELLREHPEIQKFIRWVSKRPIDYVDSSKRKRK